MKSSIIYYPITEPTATIITPPNKIYYQSGEIFNPNGMIVEGKDMKGNTYLITEFENVISEAKPLQPTDTVQKMYVLIGNIPVLIQQEITVSDTPVTVYSVSAKSYSGCESMFNSISGSKESVLKGTTVQISADVKDGHEFIGWYDKANNLISINNPYSFVVNSDITYYAKAKVSGEIYNASALIYTGCENMFSNVNVSPTSGTINTPITFSAAININYNFVGWYDSSDNLISTSNPYNTILTSNITLFAKGEEASETPDYLCFTAAEDGVRISFKCNSYRYTPTMFKYSKNLIDWVDWVYSDSSYYYDECTRSFSEILLLNNEKLYIKGNNTIIASQSQTPRFYTQGHYYCSGNIMSLLDESCKLKVLTNTQVFTGLFQECDGILTAPKLPATTLTANCYENMFYNCYSLTTVPELPATTIPEKAYYQMFMKCTSIKNIIGFSAEILNTSSCENMFNSCSILESIDKFNVRVVAEKSCMNMFNNCSKLIFTHDIKPAVLQPYCYSKMFSNCISLINPPKLKATTLAAYCCQSMFSNCTSLISTCELIAIEDEDRCYSEMFSNCISLLKVNSIYTIPSKSSKLSYYADSAVGSFAHMFKGCLNINDIQLNFTTYTTQAIRYYYQTGGFTTTYSHYLFQDLSNQGIFKCYRSLEQNKSIYLPPEGWTVEYID